MVEDKIRPLISVIVPIYRVEEYLDECIQSIRNQTYKNLEIILVDDGSNDGCGQICDNYAAIDTRIRVIHQENAGLDAARKAGIRIASGEYVGYVDGDDWIEPDMYEKLLQYAEKYGVDVVESGIIDTWNDNQKKRFTYLSEGCYCGEKFVNEIEPRILYGGQFYQHGISPYMVTKIFKRDKLKEYHLKTEMVNRVMDDLLVSIPFAVSTKSLYITHECYYHYRVRTNSLKREVGIEKLEQFIESYPQFQEKFKGSLLERDKQIDYYTVYWLIMNTPWVFDSQESENFLTPFGDVNRKAKIILYGAGAVGVHLESYIRNLKNNNVVCWVDKNFETLKATLDVCAPCDILKYEYDYVILCILREEAVKSAKKDLLELGVPENKVLWIEEKYLHNPGLLLEKWTL